MFEDIIHNKKPKEKSSLPQCNHRVNQDQCPDYIKGTEISLHLGYLCAHYGRLSYSCFIGKERT